MGAIYSTNSVDMNSYDELNEKYNKMKNNYDNERINSNTFKKNMEELETRLASKECEIDKLKDLVQSHEELINTNDVTNEDHLSKIISLENILKIKTNDLIDIKNNMIKFKENETIKFNSEKDAYESELLLMINKIKALEKINENNEKIIKENDKIIAENMEILEQKDKTINQLRNNHLDNEKNIKFMTSKMKILNDEIIKKNNDVEELQIRNNKFEIKLLELQNNEQHNIAIFQKTEKKMSGMIKMYDYLKTNKNDVINDILSKNNNNLMPDFMEKNMIEKSYDYIIDRLNVIFKA